MTDFKGKVVMITGAASGLGAAAATRFADLGARLILSDINSEGLQKQVAALNTDCSASVLDVRDEDQIATHIDDGLSKFGQLDIAINNAGIAHELAPLQQLNSATFDQVMAVNVRGPFLCMKHQLPTMIAAKSGVILNVASVAGVVGARNMAAYSASKHAVIGLTKSTADEVARFGIRVNALCPAFTETPMVDALKDELAALSGTDLSTAHAGLTKRIPLARTAQIPEIVQAMLWACAPDNSFFTGQALTLDGGLTAT